LDRTARPRRQAPEALCIRHVRLCPLPGQTKAETYRDLTQAARALIDGEPDPVANMANVAALLWQMLPTLNWAGFYRNVDGELVLGPFIGKPACIRIPFGKGVCGTAAASGLTQLVADVHAFPATSPATRPASRNWWCRWCATVR
jgi:putative methionine-R-sulfoxide reductase with GAF domain